MNKTGRLGALAIGIGTALAITAPASAAPQSSDGKAMETMRKIAEAAERKDCKTILRLGVPLIEARKASGLPGELEAANYALVILCEVEGGLNDRAYAHALRGTALDHASDDLWALRFALEVDGKRYEEAVKTIEAMAQGRGAALNEISINGLYRFEGELKDAGKNALRKRLLAVLASDTYDPKDLYLPADGFRLLYARLLLREGDATGARRIVTTLRTPSQLAEASVDRDLRGFLPADFDVRPAVESALAVYREAMARDPDRLMPIIDTANTLRQLGRGEEALTLLQGAERRLEDAETNRFVGEDANEAAEPAASDSGFTDEFEHLPWFWDSYAKTQEMLGRYHDAVKAYGQGGAVDEAGALNVSQLLNLADMQVRFGRYDDALRTIAVFNDPKRERSPYGEMVLRYVRGCSLALAGKAAEAASDVEFAKAHAGDHPGAHSHLLVCTGDMDGAAAAIIAQLEDPDRRGRMLLKMSEYDDPPVALPADPTEPRYKALKARADVKAAMDRAGGTRRFRIQAGEL